MSILDLGPATREVSRLLDDVTDDQLAGPTPCAETSVAALLDHFMGLTLAFTWAARKSTAVEAGSNQRGRGRATAEHLDPAWRAVLPEQLDVLAEAWRDPAAWEGMAEAGGTTMPADIIGVVALDELVLHGWDLARATGQSFSCDPASTAAVLGFTTEAARPERADMRAGLFGPVVEVPQGASDFDRALGLAGRNPDWTPSAG